MQSPEEFMNEYFQARAIEIERDIERRSAYRKKFFTEQCLWDSRKGEADRSRSETVLRVWYSDSTAYVITRNPRPLPELRYHLKRSGENWLIRCVEMRCYACSGPRCSSCHGKGWLGIGDEPDEIVTDPESDPPPFPEAGRKGRF
jgi:hypothetical protein